MTRVFVDDRALDSCSVELIRDAFADSGLNFAHEIRSYHNFFLKGRVYEQDAKWRVFRWDYKWF